MGAVEMSVTHISGEYLWNDSSVNETAFRISVSYELDYVGKTGKQIQAAVLKVAVNLYDHDKDSTKLIANPGIHFDKEVKGALSSTMDLKALVEGKVSDFKRIEDTPFELAVRIRSLDISIAVRQHGSDLTHAITFGRDTRGQRFFVTTDGSWTTDIISE